MAVIRRAGTNKRCRRHGCRISILPIERFSLVVVVVVMLVVVTLRVAGRRDTAGGEGHG